MTNPQQDTEEEARRREIATALGQLTGASHVKDVLLDLYAIGGRPVLDAVSQAIGEFPLGRPYLALHIHFGRRREISALPQWPDHLRLWLVRDRKAGLTKIFIHSGPMTCIRFMLVEEGFATLVNGAVSIEPAFADAVRIALERCAASTHDDNNEPATAELYPRSLLDGLPIRAAARASVASSANKRLKLAGGDRSRGSGVL